MSNPSKSFDLTTNSKDGWVIQVEVFYSKDGPNNLRGYRGYWMRISPVKIEKDFRVSNASNQRLFQLEGAKLFSEKRFLALYSSIMHQVLTGHYQDRWVMTCQQIAQENQLKINQWSAAK